MMSTTTSNDNKCCSTCKIIVWIIVVLTMIGLVIGITVWQVDNSKKTAPADRKSCVSSFQCGALGTCYALTPYHKEGKCYDINEKPPTGYKL